MNVREARADAIRRRHRDIGDNLGSLGQPPGRALSLLLDDLDAIDQAAAIEAAQARLLADVEATPPPDTAKPAAARRPPARTRKPAGS